MLFFSINPIYFILSVLCGGMIGLIFIPAHRFRTLRVWSLGCSCLVFLYSLFMWASFNSGSSKFQWATETVWAATSNFSVPLGVDGISLFYILLTTLLFPICLLASWHSVTRQVKEYLFAFLLMETLLVMVFSVLDLLLFYILFETILLPMFFVIGLWGARQRKIRAAYLFFLYTLVGSLLLLVGILYIYVKVGTTHYLSLLNVEWTPLEEKLLWGAFFLSFATKVPMFPFHLWLPEAHVEAPTAGSVLLAGILLKLGTYGFLRFSLPLFPYASLYFTPFVHTLALMGVVYTSLTAIRQTDLKRIIAYSSVAHMSLVVMGLFGNQPCAVEGALLQSLSHGFVSSALFLLVGVVYDRFHTRTIQYYGGLAQVMPLYVTLFLFFTLGNIGFPGTSAFVGEFLLLFGLFQTNPAACFFGATGMILGGGYALWLFNRVCYGNSGNLPVTGLTDLTQREMVTLIPLALGSLWMGLYPEPFLEVLRSGLYVFVL